MVARRGIGRSTRQIRTTARRRAVGRRDDGYLDVSSDEMSQIFSVLSWLPLTIRFPSGLKLTLLTSSECPLSVSVSWPSTAFFAAVTYPQILYHSE